MSTGGFCDDAKSPVREVPLKPVIRPEPRNLETPDLATNVQRNPGLSMESYVLAATPPSGSSRGCGLATGSCKVMMVPPNSYFRVDSWNALRLKDAKALSIVEGEQRNGVELMIPLKHLHQIAGVVVAT